MKSCELCWNDFGHMQRIARIWQLCTVVVPLYNIHCVVRCAREIFVLSRSLAVPVCLSVCFFPQHTQTHTRKFVWCACARILCNILNKDILKWRMCLWMFELVYVSSIYPCEFSHFEWWNKSRFCWNSFWAERFFECMDNGYACRCRQNDMDNEIVTKKR